MTEAIIFVCTILGTFIAYITYRKTYITDPSEEKKDLIHKYNFAKEQNDSLINELRDFALKNDLLDTVFMQGLTFQEGINVLEKSRDVLFTKEHENKIFTAKPSKRNLEDLFGGINNQIKHQSEIATTLNLFWKREFDN